jgi:tRNA uridine 5-carbamoylmethylation protein Kti12
MRLVFIYGPPASGKLTVAKELAKLTGFRLFHNHVSIDFVQSLFEFGSKPFWRLTDKYRTEMIEEAAKEGVDTIFTFVYGKTTDDPFVRRVLRKVKAHHGTVCFVRLECGRDELERRVTSKVRKSVGKIASKRLLNQVFKKFDLDSEIPFQPSLTIDTETQSPRKAAKMIVQHYALPVIETIAQRTPRKVD